MAGLVPAIHANADRTERSTAVAAYSGTSDVRVDARVKPGHDAERGGAGSQITKHF
jgi:hypothetical protein